MRGGLGRPCSLRVCFLVRGKQSSGSRNLFPFELWKKPAYPVLLKSLLPVPCFCEHTLRVSSSQIQKFRGLFFDSLCLLPLGLPSLPLPPARQNKIWVGRQGIKKERRATGRNDIEFRCGRRSDAFERCILMPGAFGRRQTISALQDARSKKICPRVRMGCQQQWKLIKMDDKREITVKQKMENVGLVSALIFLLRRVTLQKEMFVGSSAQAPFDHRTFKRNWT